MPVHEWYLHQPGALEADECARWVTSVYAARADWSPCFEGVQFTLGRAFYTHLEEGRWDAYFVQAGASDALVERAVPGLQARVCAILSALVGAPVTRRAGWCGPGMHIFPAGEWLSAHGGDVHFDTEGLLDHQLAGPAPALSVILMLQPPVHGGGLRVWDALYDGEDEVADPEAIPSVTIDYAVGDLIAIDSYRLHQIQPFAGAQDRISITAHLIFNDGRWQTWF